MPKALALACLFLFLAGCGSQKTAPVPVAEAPKAQKHPSPEEDPKAPGMIPAECEALLNQSQAWGYLPTGPAWKPKNQAQALEAAKFFAGFHLVPAHTSEFSQAWLREASPATDEQAQKSLSRMDRAQTCDLLLAHRLLQSLLQWRWARETRAEAGRAFLQFVLNQQARVAPTLARMVQLDVLQRAVKHGYVKVNARELRRVQAWFEKENKRGLARAEKVATPREQWSLNREELRLSEDLRERLGRILPLP